MTNETTLPTLDSVYILSETQIKDFQEKGHTYLPDVASTDEVASYRQVIQKAADAYGQQEIKPMEERDTYQKAFLKHMNLWASDEDVKRFVTAKRFGKIAAQLMGVSGVRVYHDQGLFKEPGGGVTPWHQDQYYWPVDTDNTITMWMPLVDITEDMGMLTFASHSHTQGYLGTLPISDESEKVFQEYVDEKGFEVVRQKAMKAGDATWHYGWTLHAAPGNAGHYTREVMTVIYVADGCKVTEPINNNQVRDITRWMPGLKPGDKVASKLNPLVEI